MPISLHSRPARMTGDDAACAELARHAALAVYRVLDTPPDPAFDRIITLAALAMDVPMAAISLIDGQRQWFKARLGLDAPETAREHSFCDHTIRRPGPMVVPDATLDPRFRDNPFVTGAPHVRFYAGAPLITPEGLAVGALCVLDSVPRQPGPRDLAMLSALADQVVHELAVRAALGEQYGEASPGEAARSREAMAALGRIASDVAHDINNLLQPIISLAEIELDAGPPDGTERRRDSRESLEMIIQSGRQMRAMVRKIMISARKDKPLL